MSNTISGSVAAGKIALLDNYVPALTAGTYTINAGQSISVQTSEVASSTQDFLVAAPQFSFDTTQIINQYPTPGGTGKYHGVLPHIVLKDPMLPWERKMQAITNKDFAYPAPWLAVMVFQVSELETDFTDTANIGKKIYNKSTLSARTTIGDFQALKSSTMLVPTPTVEADLSTSDNCSYIKMKVGTFNSNAPYLNELPFMAHARQINTGGQAELGINEKGLFSVLFSNRMAATPAGTGATAGKPIKNIVHLVSLEGMEAYLKADADFASFTDVGLVSLASWTFNCLPEQKQDFQQLALNLAGQKTPNDPVISADRLLFRLPAPTGAASTALSTVQTRMNDGYVPLAYHTRSGEDTFAWYRGPFSPVLISEDISLPTFYSADAAMIYDKANGTFDVSLAAAWEAGREAALSSARFGSLLLDWRRKALNLIDELVYKLNSDGFSHTDISALDTSGNIENIQKAFLNQLTPDLLKNIGASDPSFKPGTISPVSPSSTSAIKDAEAFLTNSDALNYLSKVMQDDLAPIAKWLAQMMLLEPFPFDTLVPNPELLPVESIRFFYLNPNWTNAAMDGALSLGLESSQYTLFNDATKGLIKSAALKAMAIIRDKEEGITNDTTFTSPSLMSGFLLRSALVTGWPNLVVQASDQNDKTFHILRMERLSNNVMLVIFDGVPNNIQLSQPAESLEFGVDDDGQVKPRDITTGEEIASFLTVQSPTGQACMRAEGSNVLNIDPTTTADPNSLVYELSSTLKLGASTYLSPATFGLQMVKSAESITFNTSNS